MIWRGGVDTGHGFAGFILVLGIGILFFQILQHASISEDAYITFRTVDQFAQGNGLRWNAADRVQVYTHPLWMLLHIPLYMAADNIAIVSFTLSVICAALAVWLPLTTFAYPPLLSLVAFIVPLTLSRTFIDYSTSGFENTLLHALFAWAGLILLRLREHPRFWYFISLCVALSLTTRLDTIIFYAPLGLYLLVTQWRSIRWRQALAGLAPLVAWESFSLFYYGFLFPNTKYVKLDNGYDRLEALHRGVLYFLNLLAVDALSVVWLMLAGLLTLWMINRYRSTGQDICGIYFSLGAGILCYALYVMYIGGYFVFGKSWSLPVYASIWLLCAQAYRVQPQSVAAAVACCCVTIVYPSLPWLVKQCPDCFRYVKMCCGDPKPVRNWLLLTDYIDGKRIRPRVSEEAASIQRTRIMGKTGYRAASNTRILDAAGISDPLIARLPAPMFLIDGRGRVVRPLREVPRGYMRALRTGDTSRMDKDLALYYTKLRLITVGDLWDVERLKEIIKFNAGAYDHLREKFLRRRACDRHMRQ